MESSSKNISVAAYLSPVGLLVAFCGRMLNNDTSVFVTFHIRQAFALSVIEFVSYALFRCILDSFVFWNLLILVFIFLSWWGVDSAVKERMRFQPFYGRYAEDVLKDYF